MRKIALFIIAFILSISSAYAAEDRIGVRLGYYDFTDPIVRSFYEPALQITIDYERFFAEDLSLDFSVGYIATESGATGNIGLLKLYSTLLEVGSEPK